MTADIKALGGRNVLRLDYGNCCIMCKYTKAIEWYTLNG